MHSNIMINKDLVVIQGDSVSVNFDIEDLPGDDVDTPQSSGDLNEKRSRAHVVYSQKVSPKPRGTKKKFKLVVSFCGKVYCFFILLSCIADDRIPIARALFPF